MRLANLSQQIVTGTLAATHTDGTMDVTAADGTTLYNVVSSDQVTASAPAVGAGVHMVAIGSTMLAFATVAASMGGSTRPSILPNGDFTIPGNGQAPTGWGTNANELSLLTSTSLGPNADTCAIATVVTSPTASVSWGVDSQAFTIDPGRTYTLGCQVMVDATIVSPGFWPSITFYKDATQAADNWFGTNVSNGVLTPAVISTGYTTYSTALTAPAGMGVAVVTLGCSMGSGSNGAFYLAHATLQ